MTKWRDESIMYFESYYMCIPVSYTHLVEEMLLAIDDRQSEPAEEAQQPEGEPEATQQETQPEVNQPEVKIPEAPTQTGEAAFQEWMRRMMESLKDHRSTKEELSKKIEDSQKNIESLKEDYRSMNKKMEEGQKESQKNMERCV